MSDEIENPYLRYGVGTSEQVQQWEEAKAREQDPQWQAVEGLNYLIRMQGSIRGWLLVMIVLLVLILWRVW